MINLLSKMSNS